MTYQYVKECKGHVWEKDKYGEIDIFAYEAGDYCNGPRCVVCGYGFCHHCNDVPAETCEEYEDEN